MTAFKQTVIRLTNMKKIKEDLENVEIGILQAKYTYLSPLALWCVTKR